MDNKTNRGKLVRKYIGEEIEKFKFEYKGYQNDSWKYERKFKGVIQTISIYPYRFDQRMITFELYTDVKNSAYASCEFPYKSRVMGTSEPLKPLKAPYMARNPVKWGFFRLKGQEIPLKI